MSKKIKIAVDAMGGDGSPKKVLDGIIFNHLSNKNIFYKTSYTCSNSVGKNKSCSFRSGLTILQQTITVEQMTKLLTDGRTDLLDSFVSSRTRRKFKAFLILKDDKTIGFEFVSKPKKN